MGQEPASGHNEADFGSEMDLSRVILSFLRFVLAIRFRKTLVIAVMSIGAILGGLYYLMAPRTYSSKAGLLVSQTGSDNLNVSITSDEVLRRNTMPTCEGMVRSAKVLEGAIQSLPPEDRIDLAGQPEEEWIDILRGKLTTRVVRGTSILEISYCSGNPRVAANVVRAIVQSYLDLMDRMHKGTAGEISKVLTEERNGLAEQLNSKQQALLEARRHFADMGFRSDGETLHPLVQRAVYFNDALIAAQKQRLEQQATLVAIQTAVQNGENLGQYILSIADTVGREVLLGSLGLGAQETATYANMEQALLAAQSDFQTKQQNLGPMHPEVIALAERIRGTQQYLQQFQTRLDERVAALQRSQLGPWLVQIVQQKLGESQRKERILQARFEEARTEAINLTGQLAQIELLERDVKRLTDMNDVLLNQIASIDMKQNGQDVRVAPTEEPVVIATPVSPDMRRVAIVMVAISFGVALGLVTFLDTMDDRFRSVDEIQNRLRVPLLSIIPPLHIDPAGGVESLPSFASPTATESESFRTLRTALMLAHQDARRIVITSAEPGDGKSTVLANLGICYAQTGKRTLLVDADLRRPGLTKLMNMRGTHGLSELLRTTGDVGQAAALHVHTTAIPQLDVLPSGPRPIDPAELLSGPRLSQFLAWAETVYDQILIDSPPTLAATDTVVTGRLVDGVMVVVQPGKNRRRLVHRVLERLRFMKIPVLGLVVNYVSSKDDRGYYGYGYGGYGYGYGYRYHYGMDDKPAGKDTASKKHDTAKSHVHATGATGHTWVANDESDEVIVPRRVA